MTLQEVVNLVSSDTLMSITGFMPELVLCATIVLMLLFRIVGLTSRIDSFWIALAGSVVALWFAAPWQNLDQTTRAMGYSIAADTAYYRDGPQQGRPPDGTLPVGTRVEPVNQDAQSSYVQVHLPDETIAYVSRDSVRPIYRQPIFTGMLMFDAFTIYFRVILLLFAVLFAIFTRISGIPDRETGPDFYTLVLGATLGMCIMASANHLLMIFLGVEMASVPSYVMAGMLKGRRQSSEAALKYAIYGAGTAGVMLYGISLLAGVLGSVHIPTMALQLARLLGPDASLHVVGAEKLMVLALGGLMLMVGLAFKLSAVPFHFWCPDVFEGASAEVNAFLSVASKAAALALLVRVAIGFGYLPGAPLAPTDGAVFSVADQVGPDNPRPIATKVAAPVATMSSQTPTADAIRALGPVRNYIGKLLIFISIITCTFGNLAAYGQTNIKRLLAYSTIAHAGYMIMPVAAAVVLAGTNPHAAEEALGALTFYIGVYLFMNLGAFAVVAFLRNELHSEQIADYAGLIHRCPVIVVCFSALLISLIGIPPFAGFIGKFLIFRVLVNAELWTLLVIAGLNTALSLFYYIRVVKVMTMDPEPPHRLPITISFIPGTFVVAMTLPVIVLGVWWGWFSQWTTAAAWHLLS